MKAVEFVVAARCLRRKELDTGYKRGKDFIARSHLMEKEYAQRELVRLISCINLKQEQGSWFKLGALWES